MENQTTDIRIYVACLAAYNNGILHGAWIDASQDVEAIQDDINTMLSASPINGAEEYAIHDYEGFEGLEVQEYSSIQNVCDLASFIAEHGRLGALVMQHYCDLDDAKRALDESYAGQYGSVAEFAQNITEETTEIPQALAFYIDWDAMARDMVINDVLAIETAYEQVHIFWQH